MEIYQYQKSMLERLDECLIVLSWKDHHISASQVKSEWSYFIELQIEPSGWQALWKIPRNICEKFKICYPSIVFGFVEQVNFRNLNAIYDITAVQDENVHLPERHEVALEDLWPTIVQENTELNVERTADCIDRLRFFYNHIWRPWDNDNDDDYNWVEKHLQTRIKLCFDLCQHNISRPTASFICSLIDEAKYIQQKREYIEEDFSDDSSGKWENKNLEKPRLSQLMLLHLRMTIIQSYIEILENSDMRHMFEEFKFNLSKCLKHNSLESKEQIDPICYAVILPSSISKQIELLQDAACMLPKNAPIFINYCLKDVFETYKPGDKVFLSTGSHMINFLQYFFTNGMIIGVGHKEHKTNNMEKCVRIYSALENSSLFVFDGDFTLDNIEFDCKNILAGIIVKHGILKMKNCRLIGNGKSSVQQGIMASGDATIYMEKCVIKNFATGIILNDNSSLTFKDSFITNCDKGIEMSKYAKTKFSKSSFNNCYSFAIYLCGSALNTDDEFLQFKNFQELEKYQIENLQMSGDCSFIKCKTNICIINNKNSVVPLKTFNYIEGVF